MVVTVAEVKSQCSVIWIDDDQERRSLDCGLCGIADNCEREREEKVVMFLLRASCKTGERSRPLYSFLLIPTRTISPIF